MEDELFEAVWQALVENGSSKKHKEAVKRYWDTLTAEQQQRAGRAIPKKVQEEAFVQYDPIRAIKENIRKRQAVEPENYNGRSLKSGVQYVIARYKGSYGTYSLEDAQAYGMEIKQMISKMVRE